MRCHDVEQYCIHPETLQIYIQKGTGDLRLTRSSVAFTKGAEEYAAKVALRVILVDGPRLAALMIDHDVGVGTREVLRLKDVDSDYFSDDA